ncbi:MAG TPA: ABC transporter permease [Acidimicrobiales bacterium]
MTPYIIGGLVLGGVYAISAVGLVMTFVSSKVLNFAHGAIAFFVAVAFYQFHTKWHWPLAVAAVAAIGILAPAIGLFLWAVLARNLARVSSVVMLVTTVGLYVAFTPLTFLIFGSAPIYEPPGLAGNTPAVYHVLGVAINANQVIVLAGTVVIGLALIALLRYTTAGLLIRAVVDSPNLSSLAGTDPRVVGAASWALGCFLAGLAGVLLTPLLGLDPGSFTLLVVASLAAVVAAQLRSLPLAFGGAVLLGLLQELSVKYLPSSGVLSSGIRPSLPFMLMMVFLLGYQGYGSGRAVAATRVATRAVSTEDVTAGPWVRPVGLAVIVALVVAVSFMLPNYWVGIVGSGVCLSIALLSYSVVTGQAGIISLCQISFAGIGAVATAQLASHEHVPALVAMVVGGLVAVPVALLVALLAVRLGDLYVALATLAFALLMDNLVFPVNRFDQQGAGVFVNRPVLGPIHFDGDRSFLYLALAVFLVLALVVRNVRRSTTGMSLVALRSSETGVSTLGLSVVRAKLVAFGVSGFIAGVGGAMLAFYTLRARPASFDTLDGLIWLAVVITLGVRSSVGPLLAGILYAVMPELIGTWHLPHWALQLPTLLFGLGAIGLAREPRGIVAETSDRWIRQARWVRGRFSRRPADTPEVSAET